MNRYYKVKNTKNEIVNVFIVVDTLNAYIPAHFDKIKNRNVPTTGGFIIFSHSCDVSDTTKWNYCGNMETIEDIFNYIKICCDLDEKENISLLYEVSENDAITECF